MGQGPNMQALTFFFAFVAVLALIGAAAWLVRRFAGNRLGANANRGRMPRLAVIDAAAVDGRRRLVLVRRDNIEHLLMIGGPTDIVVEPNIVRATATTRSDAAPAGRCRHRTSAPGGAAARSAAGAMATGREPMASTIRSRKWPNRRAPARPSFADELRRPAPAVPERRSDPLSGFMPEPLGGRAEPRPEQRNEPLPPRVMPRSEPIMPRPSRPSEAPKAPPVRVAERAAPPPPPAPARRQLRRDQNLAEMAQRLEAALAPARRRPSEPRVGAPPVAPEPPPVRSPPRAEPTAPPVAAPPPKTGFENLEDEMASLLGRPKTPS